MKEYSCARCIKLSKVFFYSKFELLYLLSLIFSMVRLAVIKQYTYILYQVFLGIKKITLCIETLSPDIIFDLFRNEILFSIQIFLLCGSHL